MIIDKEKRTNFYIKIRGIFMKKAIRLLIPCFLVIFITGCGTEDETSSDSVEGNEKEEEQEKEKGLVELNLYEDENSANELLDVEHEHYADTEYWDSTMITYFNEDIAISNMDEYSSTAVNWKTGEPIWEDKVDRSRERFSETGVYDDELFFQLDGDYKKIGITTDPAENTEEESSEEEFILRTSKYQSDDRIYLINQEEDGLLEAFDKETEELIWDVSLSDMDSMVDTIEELDNYVIASGGSNIHFYVLDKETGEVLYEEEDYYDTGKEVDDSIYLVRQPTGKTFEFYELDTDSWEAEKVTTFEDIDYDYDEKTPELRDTDGILTLHLHYGVIGIDTDTNEPFVNYQSKSEADVYDQNSIATIIHEDKFYVLADEYDEDKKDTRVNLSIIDIRTREVLGKYLLDEPLSSGSMYETFKIIDDDSLVIVTEEDGAYEFELSAFE